MDLRVDASSRSNGAKRRDIASGCQPLARVLRRRSGRRTASTRRDRDAHLAAPAVVLDRVADEVDQHLPQALLVREHVPLRRPSRTARTMRRRPPRAAPGRSISTTPSHERAQADGPQRSAAARPASARVTSSTSSTSATRWWRRGADEVDPALGALRDRRHGRASRSEKPTIAVSGVRSSWLMRERKRFVASFAAIRPRVRLLQLARPPHELGLELGRVLGAVVAQPHVIGHVLDAMDDPAQLPVVVEDRQVARAPVARPRSRRPRTPAGGCRTSARPWCPAGRGQHALQRGPQARDARRVVVLRGCPGRRRTGCGRRSPRAAVIVASR